MVLLDEALYIGLGDEAAAIAVDLVEYYLQRCRLGNGGLHLGAQRFDLEFHVYGSTQDAPEQVLGLYGHFVGVLPLLDIVPVPNVHR